VVIRTILGYKGDLIVLAVHVVQLELGAIIAKG